MTEHGPVAHGEARRLSGKVALVTGAGSGIGKAIALAFAAEGASIIATDVDPTTASVTADEARAAGVDCASLALDVTAAASVTGAIGAAISRFGRIDVLVNNAGINVLSNDLLATTEVEWDRVHAVDLRGVFLCMRAVLPGMIEHGGGSIVNVSSVNGLIALGSDAYAAAKAGVNSLTRNAAVHYGPMGVRVNAICPGTIVTPAWTADLAAAPDALDRLRHWYPIGRIGGVDDVTPLAVYLASDESSFVSGAVITVDGGLTAGIGPLARHEFGT